jgi:hypothetical protein
MFVKAVSSFQPPWLARDSASMKTVWAVAVSEVRQASPRRRRVRGDMLVRKGQDGGVPIVLSIGRLSFYGI